MSRLYPCVYCTEDGYCKKYSDDEVTSWCAQSPCKDEKPSNADRIRGMTDEELANFLALQQIGVVTAIYKAFDEPVPDAMTGATEEWLDWLKEEAKDD